MNVDSYTDNPDVRKAWACPDAELQSMVAVLPRIPLSEREAYSECIRLHKDYIESGLVNIPWDYQAILQDLDPYLRLRYDLQCQCYVIERVDTGLRAWIRLFRWADDDGTAKQLSVQSCRDIVLRLQACDMRRWASPRDYLQHKRDQALKIQQANDNRNTEALREAVDSMSNKQIDEFVACERAIASGERIDVRGQDAATLNMWHEITKSGRGLPPQEVG